jgi:hypothetical protein
VNFTTSAFLAAWRFNRLSQVAFCPTHRLAYLHPPAQKQPKIDCPVCPRYSPAQPVRRSQLQAISVVFNHDDI